MSPAMVELNPYASRNTGPAESSPRWLRRGATSSAGDSDTMFDDWERAQAFAGCGKDCVDERRRYRGDSRLADPAHLVTALDNRDLDHRHLADLQHRVVVEVGLLHAALLERDFTE